MCPRRVPKGALAAAGAGAAVLLPAWPALGSVNLFCWASSCPSEPLLQPFAAAVLGSSELAVLIHSLSHARILLGALKRHSLCT